MKKRAILNKTLNIENIQYEWVAEPGACKVCEAMDGTIYESANDIPDRPHPNCKCHIEIIEKDIDTTDPLENYKILRREKERTTFEIQKAQGDTASLLQEVDECLNQINKEEQKFRRLQNLVDFDKLDKDDIQMFNKAVEQIEFAKYRGEKAKQQLLDLHQQSIVLEGKIEKINVLGLLLQGIIKSVEVVLGSIINLARVVKELTIEVLSKLLKNNEAVLKKLILNTGINLIGWEKLNDARELWNFSSIGGAQEYILKNGKLYEKISDLNNNKLETIIRTKLNTQLHITEARGIVFKPESSISQEIIKSNTLKNYIHERKAILKEKRILQDGSLSFDKFDNFNLYNALGNADIIDIKLDNDNNLIAKIIDTYDFNEDDPNWIVRMARTVQDAKLLENYYEIIVIKVPYEMWINY